jgi:CheY-specific phosphatase CheX
MSSGNEFDPSNVLDQVTTSACEEMFARYGVSAKRVDDDAEPREPDFFMCAIIGFAGRDVWGTLILAVTEDISDRSNPLLANPRLTNTVLPNVPVGVGPTGRSAGFRRDWVGELSNQLLGRVKHALLRHGIEIHSNLPAVLRGRHLAPLPRVDLKPLKFAVAGGAAAVWLEVDARPGLTIGRANANGEAGAAAGDALLFE